MLSLPFKTRRVVVKLGTGILTSGIGQIHTGRINEICRQIKFLHDHDIQVVVVSSGAVGLGMGKLGLDRRPNSLSQLQACAAVGQSILIQTWQKYLDPHHLTVAQILLTHDDLRARRRHLTARETLERLLADGIVPIINENDSVSAEGIRFGDNDVLSAMVGSLIRADYLLILSTAPGLIDTAGSGQVIPVVEKIDENIRRLATGTTSATAVGGMITKLDAAVIANRSGCGVFIADGSVRDVIPKIFSGQNPGTFFVPSGVPLESKKRWLAFFQRPAGTLRVDAGARDALVQKGSSLLAKGVTAVEGEFRAGEVVNITGPDGACFARGVTQFSSAQIDEIRQKDIAEIRSLFPGRKRLEVIHRNSMATF